VSSLKLVDFHAVLQGDPMLAEELRTQASVLDLGTQQQGNSDEAGTTGVELRKKGTMTSAGLTSGSSIKACVCVAKLKLCRLACAYREIYAHEMASAAYILCALEKTDRSDPFSARDMKDYLQEHANLKSLSLDDVHCLMDHGLHDNGGECDIKGVVQSAPYELMDGGIESGLILGKEAVRQILSRPAHQRLANLLNSFVQVQQVYASRLPRAAQIGQQIAVPASDALDRKACMLLLTDDDDDDDKKLMFKAMEFEKFFDELDDDSDGFVTSHDLIAWYMQHAGCQGLINEADLESLFHPSLPDFNVQPAEAPAGGAHIVIEMKHDDTASNEQVSPLRAAQLASQQLGAGSLDAFAFSAALKQRPLLTARLVLVHRFRCAAQANLLFEASSSAALSGSESLAATAVDVAEQKRAQVLADAAISAARCAVAQTKYAWCILGQRGAGDDRGNGVVKNDVTAQELEASVKEAAASDSLSAKSQAARRALQTHFLMRAQRNLTLLLVEVALEIKLLAWREAEQYPSQVEELRGLLLLRGIANGYEGRQHGLTLATTKVTNMEIKLPSTKDHNNPTREVTL